MIIGERLRALREKRNLTLEEIGNYVGVNKATVQRYESGNIDIRRNIAIKLSEILQTNPSYVMGWSDESSSAYFQKYNYNLSDIEKKIIDDYRSLNDEGQEKIVVYVDDLVSSGKYIKIYPAGMGYEDKTQA